MSFRSVILGLIVCAAVGCAQRDMISMPALAQVIAVPQDFLGKSIQVNGYYAAPPTESLLFLTKEHASIGDRPSSIFLWRTTDGKNFSSIVECRNGHLSVRGQFAELEFGGFGLTEIERAVVTRDDERGTRVCYEVSGDAVE
jgi:hypothetical protein